MVQEPSDIIRHPSGTEPDGPALEDVPRPGGEPASHADLLRSTQDRLLFLQARSVLAGLCGCAESRAAQALLSGAARHGVATSDVGARFLAALDAGPARQPCPNRDTEQLVVSIVEAALSAGAIDQRGSRRGDPPAPRRHGGGPDGDPDGDTDPLRLRLLVLPGEREWALVVEGELDMATGPSLQETVEQIGWPESPSGRDGGSLFLDLSGVTFIDPTGAHALNAVHAYTVAHGVRLQVAPPADPSPRRLLYYATRTGWLAAPFQAGY